MVTVYFDNRKKPIGRTWWLIHIDREVIRQLSYEEAEKLIKIPVWRKWRERESGVTP